VADEIKVSDVQPLTPHDAGLYEAGKKILVDSVDVGREFCKSMITVSTGAIATYLALIGLAVGKDYRPSVLAGLFLLAAPACFLASAGVFAFGYFPAKATLSLDMPGEIEAARSAIVSRRYTCGLIGFILFAVGVVIAVAAATYGLSIDVPAPAPK
jgi:hypothetical protein